MQKTTVYLNDDLKSAITRAARLRNTSEADVIRESIRSALAADRPRPTGGFLRGQPMARQAEELLAGFGQR